jgi:DNA-binding response OmpR family regulator
MSIKARILLVEDDTNLGFVIADQLKSEGYQVVLCTNGQDGHIRFTEEEFHLCLFDVMLPKKDGFTLAKEIRKINATIPILFLTAKSMTEDKVAGFNAGGDDYLTKPFSFDELSVRVKALLKRVNIIEPTASKIITLGSYAFDTENYNLTHADFTKTLTKKEAMVLKMLCSFQNSVVPRETILHAVWGQDDYFAGRSMDVFITKLRKYLAHDNRISIANIHGIGFKLEVVTSK